MSDKPRGKDRRQDLLDTRPLRPINPDIHQAKLEISVHVKTGVVETVLVCECGNRKVMSIHPVKDFHVVHHEEGE